MCRLWREQGCIHKFIHPHSKKYPKGHCISSIPIITSLSLKASILQHTLQTSFSGSTYLLKHWTWKNFLHKNYNKHFYNFISIYSDENIHPYMQIFWQWHILGNKDIICIIEMDIMKLVKSLRILHYIWNRKLQQNFKIVHLNSKTIVHIKLIYYLRLILTGLLSQKFSTPLS